jgi:transcription antitermination factor NusG
VVATYPKAERRAVDSLKVKGFETFLPLYFVNRRDRILRTMTHRVEMPLFPSYAFVRLDLRDPWYPIRYAPGVFQLLTVNGKPTSCSDGAVVRLQAVQELAATQPQREAHWHLGDAVAPRVGPFSGLPGVVLAVEGENATVGILFLGQLREVVYPFDALVERQDY